jgi:hypothetical protein
MPAESCCPDRWSEPALLDAHMMLTPFALGRVEALYAETVPPDQMLVLTLSARQVRYYRPALEQAALALLAAMPARPPAAASEARKSEVAARRLVLLKTAQALRHLHVLMPEVPEVPDAR